MCSFFIPLHTVGTFRSIFLDKILKNVTKQFQSWGYSIFLLVDGRIPTELDPYRYLRIRILEATTEHCFILDPGGQEAPDPGWGSPSLRAVQVK